MDFEKPRPYMDWEGEDQPISFTDIAIIEMLKLSRTREAQVAAVEDYMKTMPEIFEAQGNTAEEAHDRAIKHLRSVVDIALDPPLAKSWDAAIDRYKNGLDKRESS